jgi:hypothetical protein
MDNDKKIGLAKPEQSILLKRERMNDDVFAIVIGARCCVTPWVFDRRRVCFRHFADGAEVGSTNG